MQCFKGRSPGTWEIFRGVGGLGKEKKVLLFNTRHETRGPERTYTGKKRRSSVVLNAEGLVRRVT